MTSIGLWRSLSAQVMIAEMTSDGECDFSQFVITPPAVPFAMPYASKRDFP